MTVENCLRLAEHFRSIGNTEEADAYEARAKRKLERPKYKKYQDKAYDSAKARLGVVKDNEVVETPPRKK